MTNTRVAVHPVPTAVPIRPPIVPPPPPRVTAANHIQGMPASLFSLFLRLSQLAFAAVALYLILAVGTHSVRSFRYLLMAVGLQSVWSLILAIVDLYGLVMKTIYSNGFFISAFVLGDGIFSNVTFGAASSCFSVAVLMSNDLEECNVNHCNTFLLVTVMAFVSWLFAWPSFFINFWSLAFH